MSTFVQFTPSSQAPPQFQAQLGSQPYIVTMLWNIAGQRYYVRVTDLSNNVVVMRPLTGSGPVFQATFTWDDDTGIAVLNAPHNVPIGQLAKVWISQTGTEFDAGWLALSTGPQTLTIDELTPLDTSSTISGAVTVQPLNLVEGYIDDAYLIYHEETQNFEF